MDLNARIEGILAEGWAEHVATCRREHSGAYILEQNADQVIRVRWDEGGSVANGAPIIGHQLRTCAELLSAAGLRAHQDNDQHGIFVDVAAP